jgi:2-dehydropantoate 2-reductase
MKIAVIGAGAMGTIYGGRLSQHNDVFLIDVNRDIVERVNRGGVILRENGIDSRFRPKAALSSENIGTVDLVILFVKSQFSRSALKENMSLIGDETYVMTLQNGSGHEDVLSEAVPVDRVIIGTTEDNGSLIEPGHANHGGNGRTNIGMIHPDTAGVLPVIRDCFDSCGFTTLIHENIQKLIWDKLFTNVSLSALTGILQVKMGFIAKDPHAWNLAESLVSEALEVAGAMGLEFERDEILAKVRKTSENNPDGRTSIYTDLKNGRLTEVDAISGSVVRAAKKYGVAVPSHEFVVNMVHAIERKTAEERNGESE